MKFISTVLLVVLAVVALAEARVQQRRGLTAADNVGVAGKHPYLFLSVPRGRSGSAIQGFEVIEDNDNDEMSNDDDSSEVADDNDDNDDDDDSENDDDDDDGLGDVAQEGSIRAALSDDELDDIDNDDDNDYDNDNDNDNDNENESDKGKQNSTEYSAMPVMDKRMTTPMVSNLQMILQNAKPTQMMVSKDHAGAIMVPDGIIEIEGQSVIDEKTGKAALLVPRSALEAIPDGSVVALMERSEDDLSDEEEAERANRVIVRRRRRGSRRNVRRRTNNRNRNRNDDRIRNSNRNRNGNRKRRIVRVNGNQNRNRYNQRRRVNRRQNVRVVRPNRNKQQNRRQVNRRRVNRPNFY